MLNGFWTVSFQAENDHGAGVLTVNDDDATGGDAAFIYIGKMRAELDGSIQGQLEIKRHSDIQPALIPGLDNYTLQVKGNVSGDRFNAQGRVVNQLGVNISISGKRVLDVKVKGRP